MWQLLMAFLKSAARMAAKGATAVGKATLKGAKLGLEKNLLLQALGMQGDQSNTKEALKGTAFDVDKYSSTPSTQPPSWQAPQIPPSYSPLASSLQMPQSMGPTINRPSIPSQYLNAGGQTLPPLPQNIPQSILTNNNLNVGSSPYSIPSQYMNMGLPGTLPNLTPQSNPDVGFVRGMINALTGQPQPEGIGDVSQGRKTAYYAGGVIPNIIMSKLGQPSSAEATHSEKILEAYGARTYPPALKTELENAMKTLATKNLTEEEKIFMYQDIASRYPKQSPELKRIFFPQSQDNDILSRLIASTY